MFILLVAAVEAHIITEALVQVDLVAEEMVRIAVQMLLKQVVQTPVVVVLVVIITQVMVVQQTEEPEVLVL